MRPVALKTAAALLGAAALAASCSAPADRPAPSIQPGSYAHFEAELAALGDLHQGTPHQRWALDRVLQDANQSAVRACLTGAGFPSAPLAQDEPLPELARAPSAIVWMAAPLDQTGWGLVAAWRYEVGHRLKHDDGLKSGPVTPELPSVAPAQQADYDLARQRCQQNLPPLPEAPTQAASALHEAFLTAVEPHINSAAMRDLASEYATCVKKATGLTAPDSQALVMALGAELTVQLNRLSPTEGTGDSAKVEKLFLRETAVARADAACRKPLLRALYQAAGPQVIGLRASQPELVRQLAATWAAIQKREAALPI